ncbi:hypothetical protein ACTMTJ_34900 [Phytohabitans sp. LJ34]|uniref:hypothetical protein n=1 Tax=Phytohabitans sp. LJ34 TaxID=3452217 RepID=UPI003F88FEB7
MNPLLQELSKKLAERWATLFLGPGLLFVATAALARHQGFRHAVDLPFLRRHLSGITTDTRNRETAVLLMIAAFAALAAVIAGLLVAAAGRLIERLWTPTGTARWTGWLTAWRLRRWTRLRTALAEATTQAGATLAIDRLSAGTPLERHFPRPHRLRSRLEHWSEGRPDQPTWYAQRMAALTRRLHDRYGIDLALFWPHLWTIAGADARADVQAVQDNYASAARLAGWAVAYAIVFPGTGWWPALLIALALAAMARSRARAAVNTLVPLVESMADLNLRSLADRLGVPCPQTFTPQVGAELTTILRSTGTANTSPDPIRPAPR